MFGPLHFGTAAQARAPTEAGRLFDLACELISDVTELGTQQGGEVTTRYDATAAPGLCRHSGRASGQYAVRSRRLPVIISSDSMVHDSS